MSSSNEIPSEENNLIEPKRYPRRNRYLLAMCCFLLMSIWMKTGMSDYYSRIDESSLVKEIIVLNTDPSWVHGADDDDYIGFSCKEIALPFGISNIELQCLNEKKFFSEVQASDTVTVWMMHDEHARMRGETFFSEHTQVINIKSGEVEYIGLSCRNAVARWDSSFFCWSGLIGALLCFTVAFTNGYPEVFGVKISWVMVIGLALCVFMFFWNFWF